MQTQQIGVKAFIVHDGKLLIVERSDKYADSGTSKIWDIPGGRIDFGEDPVPGLIREVFEETQLELQEIIGILDASTIHKNKDRHIIRISYLCTYKGGEPKLSEEHTVYKWVDVGELAKKQFKDKLLQKAVSRINAGRDRAPYINFSQTPEVITH